MLLSVPNIISIKKYAVLRLICCITAIIAIIMMAIMPLYIVDGKLIYPLYDLSKIFFNNVKYFFNGGIGLLDLFLIAYLLLIFGITATFISNIINIVKCARVLNNDEKETEAFVKYCKTGIKKYKKRLTDVEINSNLLYVAFAIYFVFSAIYVLFFSASISVIFNLPILLLIVAYIAFMIMKYNAKKTVAKTVTPPEAGQNGNPFT